MSNPSCYQEYTPWVNPGQLNKASITPNGDVSQGWPGEGSTEGVGLAPAEGCQGLTIIEPWQPSLLPRQTLAAGEGHRDGPWWGL